MATKSMKHPLMSIKLSKNFTLEELINSPTAKAKKINNKPNKEVTENLTKLVTNILQPIRDKWNAPIVITSGYRSVELNKAVGGSPTSQHRTGDAADIRTKSDEEIDNLALFNMIKRMIEEGKIIVGQLIWEYGSNNGPDWIHVSNPSNKHKNQVLRIKRK